MNGQRPENDAAGLQRQWEEAYLERSREAAVGRLFRGIVHNLNGVLQVASFHGDMSGLTLARAGELLACLRVATPEQAGELLSELASLLDEQQKGLQQFRDKIEQGTEILRRTMLLPTPALGDQAAPIWTPKTWTPQTWTPPAWNLNEILRCEIEFLCADSFFKHKVARQVATHPEVPAMHGDSAAVHEIVHALLENALEAVRDQADAAVEVETRLDGALQEVQAGSVELLVRDNGPGVAAAEREQIFSPFYTTRPGRPGLGLYLARRLARQLDGGVECLDGPGGVFQFWLPPAQDSSATGVGAGKAGGAGEPAGRGADSDG